MGWLDKFDKKTGLPKEYINRDNQAIKDYENWISQRKDVLQKNIDDNIDVLTVLNTDPKNDFTASKEAKKQIESVKKAKLVSKHNPEMKSVFDNDYTLGAYSSTSKNISYNYPFTDWYGKDRDSFIHERTHAADSGTYYLPQNYAITKLGIGLAGQSPYNLYLDDPKEIYSRLMEFRIMNKLDPKKKYHINDIIDMRNSKSVKDADILYRYTDDEILQLLNDIAYVPSNNITPITKNGGTIPKAKNGWLGKYEPPTVVKDIVDNLDYSRFSPEAIELRKRGFPEGFPRTAEDIRISPIDNRPQFVQGIYKTPEAIAADKKIINNQNLHDQISDFGTRTLTWGTMLASPSEQQLKAGRAGWDEQLPMVANQASLALGFEMAPGIVGGAIRTTKNIPATYNNIIKAAQNRELYKYNPLAKQLDMSMGYSAVSPARAQRMMDTGLVYRNVRKGETVHYFPIIDKQGNVKQFVPKYEKEYFGKAPISDNPVVDVSFRNGKKIKMPLEQINQGKLNKYRGATMSINGVPLRRTQGPDGFRYIVPQEPSIPFTGKSSPDIKFKVGEVPLFYGTRPNYILQADPIKSALIKPAFKKQGSKTAGYPFSVNFDLKSGDWGIPLKSVTKGEYSTLGEGMKLMQYDPVWGYREVVDPTKLGKISKLPERILDVDQNLRSLPKNISELNIIDETKGIYRGLTYPLTSDYEIAGQNWTRKNIEDFDKVASIRKLYNAISVNDPSKKTDIINLLKNSPLEGKELWITMNNSIARHPSNIDKFKEAAIKEGIFDDFIEIGKKYNSDFGESLVLSNDLDLFGRRLNKPSSHIERKILTLRQNALDKKLIEKNVDKLVKEIPNMNADNSVIPSLSRNYENTSVQLEAIKAANDKIIKGLPGIYTSAGSLSAESYPLTIMNMAKFTKDPRYEIFTSGRMTLNTMDDFANLGVSNEARANYINNFLRRADVAGKKLPRANVTPEGVSVPKVFVQKKYKTGGTIKNSAQLSNFTKPTAGGWLDKYK